MVSNLVVCTFWIVSTQPLNRISRSVWLSLVGVRGGQVNNVFESSSSPLSSFLLCLILLFSAIDVGADSSPSSTCWTSQVTMASDSLFFSLLPLWVQNKCFCSLPRDLKMCLSYLWHRLDVFFSPFGVAAFKQITHCRHALSFEYCPLLSQDCKMWA